MFRSICDWREAILGSISMSAASPAVANR